MSFLLGLVVGIILGSLGVGLGLLVIHTLREAYPEVHGADAEEPKR